MYTFNYFKCRNNISLPNKHKYFIQFSNNKILNKAKSLAFFDNLLNISKSSKIIIHIEFNFNQKN
jgi:hypothetical protein